MSKIYLRDPTSMWLNRVLKKPQYVDRGPYINPKIKLPLSSSNVDTDHENMNDSYLRQLWNSGNANVDAKFDNFDPGPL